MIFITQSKCWELFKNFPFSSVDRILEFQHQHQQMEMEWNDEMFLLQNRFIYNKSYIILKVP